MRARCCLLLDELKLYSNWNLVMLLGSDRRLDLNAQKLRWYLQAIITIITGLTIIPNIILITIITARINGKRPIPEFDLDIFKPNPKIPQISERLRTAKSR